MGDLDTEGKEWGLVDVFRMIGARRGCEEQHVICFLAAGGVLELQFRQEEIRRVASVGL